MTKYKPVGAAPAGGACFATVSVAAVALAALLAIEIASASTAKRSLAEALLALQQRAEICSPSGDPSVWTAAGAVSAVFDGRLRGEGTGLESLFGAASLSSLSVIRRLAERKISSADVPFDVFRKLQSASEFRFPDADGGLWGLLLKQLEKCGSVSSVGELLVTGLRNASASIVNREVESKLNGIPDWLWDNKVRLPDSYSCKADYANEPLTLLNFDSFDEPCLRDQYKAAYIEGFYAEPYDSYTLASYINSIVVAQLEAQDGLLFDEPLPSCPGNLRGVLCPLWLAYMNATVLLHAGERWVGDRGPELTAAMSDWLYHGFHTDFFSVDGAERSKTLAAAETLLCFFSKAAGDAYSAQDWSSAQARWLRAAAARGASLMTPDAAATETVHNALALAQQASVASARLLLELWSEQNSGRVAPGELACNETKRIRFLREFLRKSPPGIPVMFARGVPGVHKLLSGDGERQVEVLAGEAAVKTIAHSVPHRHTIGWDAPTSFDADRGGLHCPFLRRAKYAASKAAGGCGAATSGMTVAEASPDSGSHPFCREFKERNVFLVNSSAEEDLEKWFVSSSGFTPFGIGYRRCPGESLMWRVLDGFLREVDSRFDVRALDPIADGQTERWAMTSVPRNGLRLRLSPVSRSCA